MNEELLTEILKQTKRKYNHMNEILRITRDLGTALSRNDKVSAQLLLGMRGDEMNGADGCGKNIRLLIENAGIQDRERLECLLSEDMGQKISADGLTGQELLLMNQIIDLQKNIKGVLKESIQTDKAVSRRLAGEESFYKG